MAKGVIVEFPTVFINIKKGPTLSLFNSDRPSANLFFDSVEDAAENTDFISLKF